LIPNPVPHIYLKLPPQCKENKELLAFVYTGPLLPTKDDFARTPFLVRRSKVTAALKWVKDNHIDYKNMIISGENTESYPENEAPVTIEYHKQDTNKYRVSTSVDDQETEQGTTTGVCPFTVYGLTSDMIDVHN